MNGPALRSAGLIPQAALHPIAATADVLTIVSMAALGLGELESFPFVDAPDTRLVNDGYRLLAELEAVDGERRITPLGRQLARHLNPQGEPRVTTAQHPVGAGAESNSSECQSHATHGGEATPVRPVFWRGILE